jgi:hypothetical protein
MSALEMITGFATAPSSTFTALTMGSGNTLSIRNAKEGSAARILQAWVDAQTGANLRIRSPRMHDNVQGVRVVSTSSELEPLLPNGVGIPVQAQDTITVEITGSATAGDIETACLLVYYEDLPGINGRFISPEDLQGRIKTIMTVENTLALGTAGGYSGEEAINSEFDLMKANTDYALLGYLVSAECAAIGWRGVDTGNLRVGGPGMVESKGLTAEWFVKQSRDFGVPLIPVFNSANKAGILIDGVQDENGVDTTVTSIFAELEN